MKLAATPSSSVTVLISQRDRISCGQAEQASPCTEHTICWLLVTGKWQGQRANAVETALLGSALDVDTLIQALQALPKDLHPTATPGTTPKLMLWKHIALSVKRLPYSSYSICLLAVTVPPGNNCCWMMWCKG